MDSVLTDLEDIPEAPVRDNHKQLAVGPAARNGVERDETWMHLTMTRSPVEP